MKFIIHDDTCLLQTEYGELPISSNETNGFRPYQLMIASVVGCSTNLFKNILAKMRLDIHDMNISVHIERDQANANRIASIHLHFVLKSNDLPKEKVEKALAVARKNCGMIRTIENSVHVKETFEITEY
ncbi:OsmC family protein [Pueribacillus sp. YX66]|uniref:OsmC family protein n=1 Tax=Pueribacillus sp. YX66 TaxID=3229242 RepID=UPI00358D3831